MPQELELKIDCHPSGRHTLKEKLTSEKTWHDVKSDGLLGNLDEASFYKAVAKRLAEYATNGAKIASYQDV